MALALPLTDVSFTCLTSLSVPVHPNSPDLLMSSVVDLWPFEQSDSGRRSVSRQGQRQRSVLGILTRKEPNNVLGFFFLTSNKNDSLFIRRFSFIYLSVTVDILF